MEARLKERDEVIQKLSDQVERQAAEFKQSLEDRDAKIEALTAELAQVVTTTAEIQQGVLNLNAEENRIQKLKKETGALREDFVKWQQEMKPGVDAGLAAMELKPRVEQLEGVVVAKETILKEAGEDAGRKIKVMKDEVLVDVEEKTDKVKEALAQVKTEGAEQVKKQETDEGKKREALKKELLEAVDGSKREVMDALRERTDDVVKDFQERQAVAAREVKGEIEQVKQELEGGIGEVKRDIEYVERSVTPVPSYSFTVSRFSRRREKKDSFVSVPFYTTPRGYKMVVRVDAAGTDTHVSVWCCITRGEHDAILPWPLRAEISIRLVNQKDNTKHYDRQISYDKQALNKHAGRVTTGDKNYLWGLREFITVKDITNGHFLVGDALDFIVMKVELKEMDRPVVQE